MRPHPVLSVCCAVKTKVAVRPKVPRTTIHPRAPSTFLTTTPNTQETASISKEQGFRGKV